MLILEVVLNLNYFEIILAVVMGFASLFGAPYLVRQENKRRLDCKVDKPAFDQLKKDVEGKATYKYVNDNFQEVKADLKDHSRSNEAQFQAIQSQLTTLNSNVLSVLKEVKR